MSSCCLLKWSNPVLTGAVCGAFNILLLLIFLEVPLFAYVISYGGLLVIGAGLALKLGNIVDVDNFSLSQFVSKEMVQSWSVCAYEGLVCFADKAAPVVFWKDYQVTLGAALIMYLASFVFALLGLNYVLFLVVNGAFVYGKFETEIQSVAAPHVKQLEALVADVWAKIPRHEEATKKTK